MTRCIKYLSIIMLIFFFIINDELSYSEDIIPFCIKDDISMHDMSNEIKEMSDIFNISKNEAEDIFYITIVGMMAESCSFDFTDNFNNILEQKLSTPLTKLIYLNLKRESMKYQIGITKKSDCDDIYSKLGSRANPKCHFFKK